MVFFVFVSHVGYMAKSKTIRTNRIAEWRKARGLTQQQLADKVGSHWITISKLERGVMRFSDDWRDLISAALNVDELELIALPRRIPRVHVEGIIHEGGAVEQLYEDNDSEDFTLSTEVFVNPSYRWFVVAEDALWPYYQDGDKLCLAHVEESEVDNYLGRVCLAWFNDKYKQEDVVIGILSAGSEDGIYSINRVGQPPARDLKLTSLAVVALAIYYLGPTPLAPV